MEHLCFGGLSTVKTCVCVSNIHAYLQSDVTQMLIQMDGSAVQLFTQYPQEVFGCVAWAS